MVKKLSEADFEARGGNTFADDEHVDLGEEVECLKCGKYHWDLNDKGEPCPHCGNADLEQTIYIVSKEVRNEKQCGKCNLVYKVVPCGCPKCDVPLVD